MALAILLGMFGAPEIVLIVIVVLIIFGGRKIPELMKGLGKGIKEFKNATNQDDDSINEESKKE